MKKIRRRDVDDVPVDVEEEIRRLLPANRQLENEALGAGLAVLPESRRVVEYDVVGRDGMVMRVRRESYSLR